MTGSTPAENELALAELALASALDGLAGLVLGDATLKALLTVVAGFAATAIPGADGAGVTLIQQAGLGDTVVASETFVRDIDAIQYRLGEGPCISATSTGRTTRSASLADDARWPSFGAQAADHGVNSVISLPLLLAGEIVGSLNVYAHARDAFGLSAQTFGERFAEAAAVAVGNARELDDQQRAVSQLQRAASTRSAIDQAVGMLAEREGVTGDDALVRLRIAGQRAGVDLETVAHRLVASASAHGSTPPMTDAGPLPGPVVTSEGGGSGSGSFVVPSGDDAVSSVRDGVRRLLVAHRTGDDARADVDLLTAEVVSNLQRHEHPAVIRADVAFEGDGTVTVTLAGGISGPSVDLTYPAAVAAPDPLAVSGRGLGILDSLAATWGTHRQHRTTAVWFTVRDDAPPPRSDAHRHRDVPAFDALRRTNAHLRRSGHHDRAVARSLQDAMLTRLPESAHLQTAARYLTADTDDEVGGDWYDAVLHPSGAMTLVIGDVMGHDIAAAAFMGQVRNVLRAIVVDRDESPAAVLTRLDGALRELGVDTLVTVLLMRVDVPSPGPGVGAALRWASAGHPPPVIATADGSVAALDGATDLLLGVRSGAGRTDHVDVLPPGATLLLYTDGLVERRDRDVEVGQRELFDAVAAHRTLEPGPFLDAVLADTVGGHPGDDVAVLVARLH